MLPLIFSGMLYFVVLYMFMRHMSFSEAIASSFSGILKGNTLTLNAWYVYLLILFCVFFLICFFTYKKGESIKNTNVRIISLSLLITISIFIMLFVWHWGGWWSKSCYAFPMGIIWGFYSETLKKFIVKYFNILFLGGLVAYLLPWICERQILYPISSCAIVILFLLFLSKYQIKSRIMYNVGKYSFEIYLIHGLVYSILGYSKIMKHYELIFVALVFVISYICAMILKCLFQKVAYSRI